MKLLPILTVALLLCTSRETSGLPSDQAFRTPPPSARPWVYWFWLNGNVTSNGITGDLESMQRSGIGGVLIMEVDQGAPIGPAAFAQPAWRELFKHVIAEAHRLGLEVNMNNDAGWCGSGGPWITPELAMQNVVWTETNIAGPFTFKSRLPSPQVVSSYYRDIAVLAFPTPASNTRLESFEAKSALTPTFIAPRGSFPPESPGQVLQRDRILQLNERLGPEGDFTWDVPEGNWTILRMGHTPTGKDNHPAPEAGRGLECDKLSRKAVKVMFEGLMGKLIADSKPLVGKALVSTHIDSWEVGSQNWTEEFPKEFWQRRGYELGPWLPALSGRVIGSVEQTERFLWDLRQTISDLLLDNYAGYFGELAHEHNMRLSVEAYSGCPVDELAYAGRADEPMGEFWAWTKYGMAFSCTEMTSAAHAYGKKIVGAEAFTSGDQEKWLGHPGNIKDLGDWAFCEGINRFVFHRYALQPWDDVRPGMAMGPWGLHYERTQIWWNQSRAWHEYLARCQYLLQQGLFVADICLLSPEGSPQTIERQKAFLSRIDGEEGRPFERPGHNFDVCPPEALLKRMMVKKGLLTLPDGMSYRLLALPNIDTMTPELLRKIRDLIRDGATVVGPRPYKSPSLVDYPRCDEEVNRIAEELWGREPGQSEVAERRIGKGRLIHGHYFHEAQKLNRYVPPRLSEAKWIWHNEGTPASAAPVGTRHFRKLFIVEPGVLESAQLLLSVDNSFECLLNGERVGSGDDFTRVTEFDLRPMIRAGTNVLAIRAVNGSTHPNPAGVVGGVFLKYQNGKSATLLTDASWESANQAAHGWQTDVAAAQWQPVLELGRMGMQPWRNIELNSAATEIYPDIKFLGRLLAERGVDPDFAYETARGDRALRFIHKRTKEMDLYFVANKTAQAQKSLCSFRVSGRRPELWRPETGEVERTAVYDLTPELVRVPITLDPYESVFVVFKAGAKAEKDRIVRVSSGERTLISATELSKDSDLEFCRDEKGNVVGFGTFQGTCVATLADGTKTRLEFPALPAEEQVPGPWRVDFQGNFGAPGSLTMEKLIAWNEHSDAEVRFFSGEGVYTTTLVIPGSTMNSGQKLFLDLGVVAVSAEVRINGKPAGTAWKAPYRLEITGLAKAGKNLLEIRVANLWVNRQIGDEQLPEDSERNPNGTLKSWPEWLQQGKKSPTGRHTFTSWRLWRKDSALRQSGLLGPVRVVSVPLAGIRPARR